jgi:hypothetical protein
LSLCSLFPASKNSLTKILITDKLLTFADRRVEVRYGFGGQEKKEKDPQA